MKSRVITLAVIVAGLSLTGWALRAAVIGPAGRAATEIHSRAFGLEAASIFGVLGNLRAAAADVAWLRMAGAWESRDSGAVLKWLGLVAAVDPKPIYFWVNGARIMAYDVAEWRIADSGGRRVVPASVQARMAQDQAERALEWLNKAMGHHPASAALWVERANLEFNRLGDARAAAESYRRAWMQPGAPYFAARLHAELLRRAGERRAALDWLAKLHPQLPRDSEEAEADLVLARIRDLEKELGVTAENRFRPGS